MDSEDKASVIIFACLILFGLGGIYFLSNFETEKEKTKQLEIRLKYSQDSIISTK